MDNQDLLSVEALKAYMFESQFHITVSAHPDNVAGVHTVFFTYYHPTTQDIWAQEEVVIDEVSNINTHDITIWARPTKEGWVY